MSSSAASAARKKIVVCGGNGFLGSRICKAASARGWDVISVSRSGDPNWSSITASSTPPPWAPAVTWAKGDILKPSTYRPHLEDADYIVHSMGILFEADYKGVLQGRESPLSGLRRAFSSTKQGTQNPLDRNPDEDLKPQEHDGQLTYEVMNRDSAISLAHEAYAAHEKAGSNSPLSFAYVSAAAGAPVLPERYITTKRQAEETIASTFPRMRSIFIRPGMLYDSSRSITMGLAGVTAMGAMANSITGGRLEWLMGAGGTKPLKADVVAEAVVESLDDADIKGVVDVAHIEKLANTAWRKGML